MAMTALEIRVFAEFPLNPVDHSGGWDWVHCLTFPLDTLNNLHFAQKPYKWIRYAIGVVVGAEGHLSFNRDSPHDVMEYDRDNLSEFADLYYHTSDAEKQRMFPADPDLCHEDVTSSDATSRRADFRDDVAARDRKCVLTGFKERLCDAVHLLPHSKGDEYIETYTERRSRNSNDFVSEINDVRNGVLLNKFTHVALGREIAFLVTPNFAMSTADIDPTAPPEKRCTANLFVPDEPSYLGDSRLSSGSLVRMPLTTDQWPPDILFDAVYAGAVLAHFAPQTMKDTLGRWESTFYPERAVRTKEPVRSRDRHAARRTDRTRHRTNRSDYLDYLMVMPYILMDPEKVQEARKEAMEKKAEEQRRHLNDKIESWVKGVANASP